LDRQELWARVNEDLTIRIPLGSGVAGKCAGGCLTGTDGDRGFNIAGADGFSTNTTITIIITTTTITSISITLSPQNSDRL
jgi:hypothetical protein